MCQIATRKSVTGSGVSCGSEQCRSGHVMSVTLRQAQQLVLDHPFCDQRLDDGSRQTGRKPSAGRHLADVGQQPLAKTVELGGGMFMSVANRPRFCAPEDFGPGGSWARMVRAMTMRRPIAASPFRTTHGAWSRMFFCQFLRRCLRIPKL